MAANTFSDLIATLKLASFVSTTSSLTAPDILKLANRSYRSYIVPFLKTLRDEWQVSKVDYSATTDSSGRVAIPNSVASTVRTVAWNNNGRLIPLSRIEPENAFAYQRASSVPAGFMLKGYELQILPIQSSAWPIVIAYMKRPPIGVLEEDAGEIDSHVSLALTLGAVPLEWQASAPTAVDLISSESPFSPVAESVAVVSLVGSVLTLTGIDPALVVDGFWVADVGASPYPNLPIELHPLLELDVICTLLGTIAGDKRLKPAKDDRDAMRKDMLALMAPRSQGSIRPIVNRNAVGMGGYGWWNRYGGLR